MNKKTIITGLLLLGMVVLLYLSGFSNSPKEYNHFPGNIVGSYEHGSCVYAVEKWHNPKYVEYCVPELNKDYYDSLHRLSVIEEDNLIISPPANGGGNNNPVVNPPSNPPKDNNSGEKQCKNKNDGKDNNHNDCNAGKGNDDKAEKKK